MDTKSYLISQRGKKRDQDLCESVGIFRKCHYNKLADTKEMSVRELIEVKSYIGQKKKKKSHYEALSGKFCFRKSNLASPIKLFLSF